VLTLIVLPHAFTICRLPPTSSIPDWVESQSDFSSINRTRDELSIVCGSDRVPGDIEHRSDGWRCIRFEGKFNFDQTGILASLLSPLAASQISVLTFGTFDTDYVLIRQENLTKAIDVITASGHKVFVEQTPAGDP
jgi:hypothetical protein